MELRKSFDTIRYLRGRQIVGQLKKLEERKLEIAELDDELYGDAIKQPRENKAQFKRS